MTTVEPTATRTVRIAAPAEQVYALVTDLDALAECAEETTSMRWRRGSSAVPGAQFVGVNRNGALRRWTTRCTVTDAVPGRLFAFEVAMPMPGGAVARWQYDLRQVDGGCELTESTWDRRSRPFAALSGYVTGVHDRAAASREHIAVTLDRIKARLEQS